MGIKQISPYRGCERRMKMDKKLLKLILVIAVPVIIENLFQVLLGITDTFFVSKISEEAIAAVGITNLWMNVMIAFFVAIGIGTVALVSRAWGRGDKEEVAIIGDQTIVLSTLLGILFGFIFFVFRQPILSLLGASGGVLKFGIHYFNTVAVPVVFLSLHMGLSSVFKAVGMTKLTMKVGLVMNIINILLDYILILGFGIIPPMGIIGAGLATTVSRIIGASILYFYWRKEIVRTTGLNGYKPNLHVNKSIDSQILKVGIPAGIEKLFMRFGQLIYGWLIIRIGTADYIGHNIAGTIESVSYLPAMGFGVAAATLIGQSLGKKEYERAKQSGWYAYLLGSMVMVMIASVFFFGGEWLAMQFTDDPLIIEKVASVLKLIALFQPFLGSTTIIASALQGAGETRMPMILTGIGIWGIRITGVYVLGLQMGLGLFGVWIAYVCDIVIRGSILLWLFNRGKWQDIELPRVVVD